MSSGGVDLAPLALLALIALALAALPLAWVWRRHRHGGPRRLLHALALLTLVLSFDLVLLGAFTRLSDSGLGCPDWPGCYGHASPVGAREHIGTAQAAMPHGPVTHGKAWVEMLHRYAAAAIGVLTIALLLLAWRAARAEASAAGRLDPSPRIGLGWAWATLLWILVQGAFGALTVTWRLYPAVVTLHLLGGMALLALLAAQVQAYDPDRAARRLGAPPGLAAGIAVVALVAVVQIALGAWVSSNYAVLACRDVPTCQGQWWPPADFASGFELRRELGSTGDGGMLPFPALTAIHLAHRLGALAMVAALLLLAWRLARRARLGGERARPLARYAQGFVGVAAWQVATGLGNVLLGWPLLAAVLHTAGAAMLVVLLASLAARLEVQGRTAPRAAVAASVRPARVASS